MSVRSVKGKPMDRREHSPIIVARSDMAALLVANGHDFVNLVPDRFNPTSCVYEFEDCYEVRSLVRNCRDGNQETLVDWLRYTQALRDLNEARRQWQIDNNPAIAEVA